jgi:hypothetical protein
MTDKDNLPFLLGKTLGFMRIGEANSNKTKKHGQGSKAPLDLVNTRVANRMRKGAKRIGSTIFPKIQTYYRSLDEAKAGTICNERVLFYSNQLGSELPKTLTTLEQSSFWLGYISAESEYWQIMSQKKADKANKTESNSESESESECQQLTLPGANDNEI